jgi:hypothetical protein
LTQPEGVMLETADNVLTQPEGFMLEANDNVLTQPEGVMLEANDNVLTQPEGVMLEANHNVFTLTEATEPPTVTLNLIPLPPHLLFWFSREVRSFKYPFNQHNLDCIGPCLSLRPPCGSSPLGTDY